MFLFDSFRPSMELSGAGVGIMQLFTILYIIVAINERPLDEINVFQLGCSTLDRVGQIISEITNDALVSRAILT